MFLKSERFRFFYKETPKCGSTTLIHRILQMHGINPGINPRRFLRKHSGSLLSHGLSYGSLSDASDEFYADLNRNFFSFSVVRNPYDRTWSNYCNKLNRYAANYASAAYVAGKCKQLLMGPKAWGRANEASRCIARYLSYGEFVRGLVRHGVQFDSHYWTLCDLLLPGRIDYDLVLKLETLENDLASLDQHLKQLGVEYVRTEWLGRLNESRSARSEASADQETQNLVHQIYQNDFEAFGYASNRVAAAA